MQEVRHNIKIQFCKQLGRLYLKYVDLVISYKNTGDVKYERAAEAMRAFRNKLDTAASKYFKEPDEASYQIFKNVYDEAIKTHGPELEKHRGISKILVNIAALIGSLFVGYGIAYGLSKLCMGSKYSFFATDSANLIHGFDKLVTKATPSPAA